MKKRFSALLAASLIAVSGAASAATAVFDQFTLTYDDTTLLGGLSFSFGSGDDQVGFGWTLPNSIFAADDAVSFDLPSFTITENPGFTLHGDIGGSIGNLPFSEFLTAPASSASLGAAISIDGAPAISFLESLTRTTVTSTPSLTVGYFSLDGAMPVGPFTALAFSGGHLDLSALGTAAVYSQAQSEFRFYLSATPVPELGALPMLLAGLGIMIVISSRRLSV